MLLSGDLHTKCLQQLVPGLGLGLGLDLDLEFESQMGSLVQASHVSDRNSVT